MRFLALVPWTALALAGACAGTPDEGGTAADRLYLVPFDDAVPRPADDEFRTGDADAWQLEFTLERADGSRFLAPRLVAYDGQACSIAVGESSGDARTGVVRDGLAMEMCATRVADGGVSLGYRIHLAKVRTEAAAVERADAEGARWVEPGVQALLARVPSPDDGEPMLVFTRLSAVRVEACEPNVPGSAERDLGRPMSGHTRHLRVSAVEVNRGIAPGTVLDETALPDVLKPAGGTVLRDLEAFTCIDSRLLLANTLESAGVVRGLVVRGRDDGRLEIAWTTVGSPRTATIRPNQGRRFVALASVGDDATAGVIVSLDAD